MRFAVLIVGLAFSACAAPPVGAPVPVADLSELAQSCPRAPTPPEYRFTAAGGLPAPVQAVIDRALTEWRHWGRQIVDYRAIDWTRTAAVRELIRSGLPEARGRERADDLVVPVVAAAGCWENDPRMFAALRAYWRPLQDWLPVALRRERYADDLIDSAVALSIARPPGWTEAWSAAFVSYVVAGAVAAGEFRYSRSHFEYVGLAVDEFHSATAAHRYVARPVTAFAPRAGDLICSYRNQPRRDPWEPALADWRLGPAHCDIVVAIEQRAEAGRVFAVGGNIFQSVSVSVHALTADGRLVDGRFRNWAIVLADRANPAGLALPSAAPDR
jgi:hypothetical protein